MEAVLNRVPLVLAVVPVALLGLALAGPASAQSAPAAPPAPAADFAARLAAALEEGPAALNHLFVESARDETERLLDVRSWALFSWSEVAVQVESATERDGGWDAVFVVRGLAAWTPQAWGVAAALWTLQTDERHEVNRIVRREEWRLVPDGAGWRARSRHLLSPVEIVDARIEAGVYPGHDALLLDVSWYVRALADSVRHVRFLLDRRAHIYDLRVDGRLARLVRGSELGSLGLEGWSPEVESSLELPVALHEGEQATLRFRIRAPLVHMTRDGVVTTLPLDEESAFRERIWMPVPDPPGTGCGEGTTFELSLRWEIGKCDAVALSVPEGTSVSPEEHDLVEEEGVGTRWWGGLLADLDFSLGDSSAAARGPLPGQVGEPIAPGIGRIERERPSDAPSWRDRSLVFPPMYGATQVSRDLTSELQDLLPLDFDLLDEVFDDSAGDAERGADDRGGGG